MRTGTLNHRIAIQQQAPPTLAIEAMSKAAACQVSSAGHAMRSGFRVVISGVVQTGWTGANGTWVATVTGTGTFTIPFDSHSISPNYVAASNPSALVTVMADEYAAPVLTWTNFAEVWAEILPLRGAELFTAQQFQSKV